MASRYQPLADFLAAQRPETLTVTLTLSEIDALVAQPLPPSAHASGWWWNVLEKPHSQTWMDAGWRVVRAQVGQTPRLIIFQRVSLESGDLVGD